MTKGTKRCKRAVTGPTEATHQLARALFQLRLNVKALAAATDEDDAIAHPSGVPINRTAFHSDALEIVRKFGVMLVRESLDQVVTCFRAVPARRDEREIVSALRAIRSSLETVAEHHKVRPFTNELRIGASVICAETCDLCALALRTFAVRNFSTIGS